MHVVFTPVFQARVFFDVLEQSTGCDDLPVVPSIFFGHVLGKEVGIGLAHDLLNGTMHQVAVALVSEGKPAFQVLANDDAGQALYQRMVQGLRFPQCILGLAALELLPTLNRLGQIGRGGRAIRRPLGQRPQTQGLQRRRHVGPELARRGRLLLAHLAHGEGRHAGQDFVEDRAQAVDVRAAVDQVQPAGGLLRGHVGRRSQRLALHRVAAVGSGVAPDYGSRSAFTLRPADQFRQSPVEDDDLAEITQDDILSLEVAVDDAARMAVSDSVTDRDKSVQERRQLQRIDLARQAPVVVRAGRFTQGATLDEAHRVERLPIIPPPHQLVDRDNARVLQLAGDLRLLEKTRPEFGMVGPLGPKLLQRDIAAEFAVVGQPNAADATGRVQSESGVAIVGCGCIRYRRNLVRESVRRGQRRERALNVVVPEGRQAAFDVVGDGREAGRRVAAVLLQLAAEQVVHMRLVGGHDPAPLDEHVCQRHIFAAGPQEACVDELPGVDQIGLQGEHTEQEVAVGVHGILKRRAA